MRGACDAALGHAEQQAHVLLAQLRFVEDVDLHGRARKQVPRAIGEHGRRQDVGRLVGDGTRDVGGLAEHRPERHRVGQGLCASVGDDDGRRMQIGELAVACLVRVDVEGRERQALGEGPDRGFALQRTMRHDRHAALPPRASGQARSGAQATSDVGRDARGRPTAEQQHPPGRHPAGRSQCCSYGSPFSSCVPRNATIPCVTSSGRSREVGSVSAKTGITNTSASTLAVGPTTRRSVGVV